MVGLISKLSITNNFLLNVIYGHFVKSSTKASTSRISPKHPINEEKGETIQGIILNERKHKKHGSKKQ